MSFTDITTVEKFFYKKNDWFYGEGFYLHIRPFKNCGEIDISFIKTAGLSFWKQIDGIEIDGFCLEIETLERMNQKNKVDCNAIFSKTNMTLIKVTSNNIVKHIINVFKENDDLNILDEYNL